MSRTKLAILRIFAWFHLFGVPALVFATSADGSSGTSSTSTDISHLSRPTGRVSLFSFERGHLRTVSDHVDAEVVLNSPPKYFEAYLFECNATYPVQWAYIGEAAPVVTADVGRFFKDFYDINTYTYQSILLMYSLKEMQSGRYICRGASKEHDKLAIHYDVFVPGNGTQILLSTKEKKLFIPENKEHAYIPCGVSDSTAAVNLYRGNQWGTFYPVPVNGSITFNPRKGFKIRFKDFLDPWGTYLCISSSNKRRRKVHLIPESLKAKYDLINHVNGKIPVYFSYEYEYNRVLCCTGTNFIPKLQWAGCGSILDCQVKSACFEEDRCEQRLGNSGYIPSKWVDPGPLPPGCSGYRLRDDPNGDFGLFKCSTPGIAQYQPYLLNRGNIFLDFEKTPPSEMILTLQRISSEGPSFVGDEVEFHCNSTRFYFAYGIRWGWEKLMGEIEFIDDATVIRDKYSVRGHRRRTTFRIPHSDIKAIICFVPVVNSATEWRTVSLPMVIAASDVNYIQHPNPINPANNVIDLDSITYHTDYDTPALELNNQGQLQNQNQQQQQEPLQHQVAPRPNHDPPPPSPPQNQHQNHIHNNVVVDGQKYVSSKSAVQEFHQVVPTTSVEQQQHQDHLQNNPNYYNYYTHDNTAEQPHPHLLQEHVIITTHPESSIPQNSHNHNVHPLVQPQTVDVYASAAHVQASPSPPSSPDIISISRSKKTRSRTSSTSSSSTSHTKSVPISKSPDVLYDDTLVENPHPPSYDTFEPRPSSSISSNARLHHHNHNGAKIHSNSQKMRTTSTRIPHHQTYTTTTVVANKRPPTSPQFPTSHRVRNNNHIFPDEILYSSPKKSYRDYNNFNDNGYHITDDMRLSLPFEPAMPNMGRGRYAHGSKSNNNGNGTVSSSHVRRIPIRTSSSHSHSHSHVNRPNSRRPSSSGPVPSTPSNNIHHHTSSRTHHHHNTHSHNHHNPHGHNEDEKDYTIDDSYSQHVRLSLPAKSTVAQVPKSQKANRNRQTGQGRSKSTNANINNHHNHHQQQQQPQHHHNPNANADYYYTDDSPVEIKVPRMKAHESHSSRPHHHHHHHQSHSHKQSHNIHEDVPQEEDDDIETNIEAENYQSSPTTYLRRKPSSSSGDFYVRPTSQTYVHDVVEQGSSKKSQNHYQNPHHHHRQAPQSHPHPQQHISSSTRPKTHHHQDIQDAGKAHQIQFISKSSPSGRRSHSRGLKFNADPLPNVEVVADAYEFTSPTARPAYFVSAPNHPNHHQHKQNQFHHIHHHHSGEESGNESQLQNSNSNEFIKAMDMELKRVEPRQSSPIQHITSISKHKLKPGKTNSSDILHSVSISISSKITHSHEGDSDTAAAGGVDQISTTGHKMSDEMQKSMEGEEVDDYDIYSPKYKNYRKSTTPSSIIKQKHVPIQLFHVKPNEMSSFMPAKSIIDEEDEDEFI